MESPARRPRCGAPRLRATRRRAPDAPRQSCGPAAFDAVRARSRGLPGDDRYAGPPFRRLAAPAAGVALRAAPRTTVGAPRGVEASSLARDHHCRHRSVLLECRRPTRHGAHPPRPYARRLGGPRGASRSARQAAGATSCARAAGRGTPRPQGKMVHSCTTPARNLLARRRHRWLDDARRDARGVGVPRGSPGRGKRPAAVFGQARWNARVWLAGLRNNLLVVRG